MYMYRSGYMMFEMNLSTFDTFGHEDECVSEIAGELKFGYITPHFMP